MLAASIPTVIPIEVKPEAGCISGNERRVEGRKARGGESRISIRRASSGQKCVRTMTAATRRGFALRLACSPLNAPFKNSLSGSAIAGRRRWRSTMTTPGSTVCMAGSGLATRSEDETAEKRDEDTKIPFAVRKLEIAGQLETSDDGSFSDTGVKTAVQIETDKNGVERVAFRPEGYNYWTWRGHKIHYIVQGEGQPLVLVHGFGASAYHWRYNIPALAKKFKVYAVDLLGFGWSDKALVDYDMHVWGSQLSDFVKQIIGEPAIYVGNSVGAFTVLATASLFPEAAKAVVLINAAGQFENPKKPTKSPEEEDQDLVKKYILTPILRVIQRVGLWVTFTLSKQRSRIISVLKKVYIDTTNVDDYLVESISQPSLDPNAAEVYYRVGMSAMVKSKFTTFDKLLENFKLPLLLLWGELDPWIEPTKATRIMSLYPRAEKISVQAGHCPHDESPEQFNEALTQWVRSLSI